MEQPALFDTPAPVAVDGDTSPDWRLSVRLYIEEIEAVAAGELPDSLRQYCQDGLVALQGTPEEAGMRADQRIRAARTTQRRTA